MTERGQFMGHVACDECGSSDSVAVYQKEDGSVDGYCWSECQVADHIDGTKKAFKRASQIEGKEVVSTHDGKPKKPREPITERQKKYIEEISGFVANGYRGISDRVLKFTGIRTELNEEGNVVCRFYPAHNGEGELVGYKRRYHPKDFTRGPIGQAGLRCQLLGQNLHRKGSSKRLLIASGEEDYAAAVQMLRQYQRERGQTEREPMAVVSPLVGESGAYSQIKNNMSYLEGFDEIVICMDMDDAGKKAAENIAMILPEGKAYIMEMPEKDANACLTEGKQKQFIDCYFKAKPYSPSVIKGSSSGGLLQDAVRRAQIPKIPLPPFLEAMSDLLAGGIPLGYIVNIASASGQGKSTLVNELTYFWILECMHKVGIISLEATAGEYFTSLLSRHTQTKIELIAGQDEKVQLLTSEYMQRKSDELCVAEDGSDRFYLLDDRGDINSIQKNIETMIKVNGCKVIIVDPLQDILDEITTEEEAQFMRWQKRMIAKYEVTIINVNHVRKSSGNDKQANSRGKELNEEDMQGSSSIFKSGAINITMTRDKMAECPIARNTIKIAVTKARGTGQTGSAGEIYYDIKSHTLYKMTEDLKAELLAREGMINPDVVEKEFSHTIPEDFIEDDVVNQDDTPF